MFVVKLHGQDVIHEGKRLEFATEEAARAILESTVYPALRRIGREGGPSWGYTIATSKVEGAP